MDLFWVEFCFCIPFCIFTLSFVHAIVLDIFDIVMDLLFNLYILFFMHFLLFVCGFLFSFFDKKGKNWFKFLVLYGYEFRGRRVNLCMIVFIFISAIHVCNLKFVGI